jgi:hypothetical protein
MRLTFIPNSYTFHPFNLQFFKGFRDVFLKEKSFMLSRVLVATIAGGVAFFALGFLIYGLLLDPYMKANMISYPGLMKEPMPDMVPLIVANLANAFLFAFIFDYWAGIRTFVGGLKGGAILMFLTAVIIDLQFLAFMNLWKGGFVPVIVDIIAATILGALSGGVIGLVLGLMSKGSAATPAAAE